MKNSPRFFFIFILFLFMFFGCHKKSEEVNDKSNQTNSENYTRLSKEELIPILKDVLLVESAIYFKANQGADVKTLTYFYYNLIFKKYNISRPQFNNSLKYHLQKDTRASSIFLGAINMLTVETDSVRKNETSLKEPDIKEVSNQVENKKSTHFFGKRPK